MIQMAKICGQPVPIIFAAKETAVLAVGRSHFARLSDTVIADSTSRHLQRSLEVTGKTVSRR
jgi:hypothetical protein